ncbi:MAG: DUF6049 family protein, partial [Leifsonia sp.]
MSPFRLTRFGAVRRFAVVLAAALAVALAPVTGASAAPVSSAAVHPAQATRTATDSKLTASLAADSAGVLAPGQDLGVSVTITNPSATAYLHGTVSLWVDPTAQTSRTALTTWLDSTDSDEKTVVIGKAAVGALEPGTSTVVRVTVPSAALPFAASPGEAVFGLGATATVGPSAAASARSSIVWSPGPTATPSMVGVVLPIVAPSTAKGVLSATDLATYTAPNGVLTRDLDGLDGLPKHTTVGLGIDPMIVASIRALGNAAPASARDWLQRLTALPNDTFSLGFGDADLTGQLQSGLTQPLAP